MINGLEGIPGSGKSYEAVAYHVLPALQAGRKVITNLPLNIDALAAIDPTYRDLVEVRTRPTPQLGDWNAANIAEQEAFQLWTDKEPIPQSENVFTFGTVWDYYSEWRGSKNQGPCTSSTNVTSRSPSWAPLKASCNGSSCIGTTTPMCC
ncbi:MAG: zonular occludens toxin domain-containing protein [Comamonas thiooxydans]